MDWLLGCFKCRQRRRGCSSLNLSAKCKEQSKIALNAVPWNANFTQTQATSQGEQLDFNLCPEKCEVERDVPTQGNDLDKSLAVSINTEKRRFLATKRSSDQLLQVEKLEEELNNLSRRLVEEANEAKNLRNEVRYLQNCGELLDSPDAFKKALDDLQRASKQGQVEESGHLLLLQSVLTKIESEGGALVEPCLEKKEKNRSPSSDAKSRAHIEIIEAPEDLLESIDSSSLVTWTESESSLENLHGKTVVTGPDRSQSMKVLNSLNFQSASSERRGHSSDAERKLLNTRLDSRSDYVILDAKQPRLIPVARRRRSTSLSFSGLFLVEDEVGNRFTSEQFAIEDSNSTESQGLKPSTKIIEETDLSSENIDEASKSLFAFATDAPQSQSVSAGQVISLNVSRDDIFSNADSEVNSHSVDPYANDSCFTWHQRPSRGPWSPKDHRAHEVQCPCANTSMEQSQVGTSEDSYDGFSDASSHISAHHSSKRNDIDDFLDGGKLDSDQMSEVSDASSSRTLPQLHVSSVEDKASAKKITNPHATVRASTMSQEENAILWKKMSSECSSSTEVQSERVPSKEDYPVLSQQHWSAASTNTIERWISRTTGFELKNSDESLNSEIQILIETFEETNSKEASLSGGLKQSSSDMVGQNKPLVSELSGEGTFKQELTPSRTRTVTSPDISTLPSLEHGQIPELGGQSIAREQLPAPGATSSLTLDSEMSPYTIHTESSLLHVTAKQGLTPHRPTSNLPTEMLTTMPNSVHSQLPVPSLSDKGTSKQQLTPSRTLLASTAQVETPNCIQSQGSPAKLAEDRPILGTVAAHWSHSSSTQKWWDGKGIPNSTNKYKEDQKVSWHATPFEVRLERALAKQGRVLQKKLFAGAMATEMEVSTGPITSPS